jgi:hypothetical protein
MVLLQLVSLLVPVAGRRRLGFRLNQPPLQDTLATMLLAAVVTR